MNIKKEVSLYIPVYNAAKYLDRVIPAVLFQTYPLLEILIIDDGSTDNSVEIAEKYIGGKYPLRVIKQGENKGLGAARNLGVTLSKGEYVASLDSDVLLEKNWLETIMDEIENSKAVGVGGIMIESFKTKIADRWRDTFMRQSWGDNRVENPKYLYGSNTVYKRQILLDAGLYSERCRTNGDDLDIVAKINKLNGILRVYTPKARCYHLRQDTFKSVMKTCWKWGFYGNWTVIGFWETIVANYNNFRRMPRYWGKDLREFNISNMIIDFLYPFLSCYWDWKEFLNANGK